MVESLELSHHIEFFYSAKGEKALLRNQSNSKLKFTVPVKANFKLHAGFLG